MGQIKTDYIKKLPVTFPKVFVETGTFLGGIPLMSLVDKSFDDWDKMYTIELSEECCKIASTRYKLYEELGKSHDFKEQWSKDEDKDFNDREKYFDGKLHLLQGDSSDRLKDVLDEVDERCAFWLDAHAGAKDLYTRGEVDCPLLEELNIIKDHKIKEHLIAIDDAHLFGETEYKNGEIVCDYSKITRERVEGIIKSINPKYTIEYHQPYGQLMLVAYVEAMIDDGGTWWKNSKTEIGEAK